MALNHHEIIQNIVQQCNLFLGIEIKVLPTQINLSQFERERFGEFQSDLHQTSLSEFIVKKMSPRHIEPPKRILCLTETTLLERDPQTYNICTLRPLKEIFALIRNSSNIQVFGVEYKNGDIRSFSTNDRDSLLATLLDAVRSSGNMDVHVRSSNSERSKRVVPLYTSVDEETEANLMRYIMNFYQYPVKRGEVLDRFNANIPYSGLNYSVSQDVSFYHFIITLCIYINNFNFRHYSLKIRNVSSQLHCRHFQQRTPILMLHN
jgi:DnaJ homolog subfamily C member 13